jgi:hypothetical protein
MLPLSAAPFDIDHVIVAGRDLKAMQAALAAVGLASEYGGPHTNHATEMSLTSFPDGSYLELLAMQPNADAKAVAAYVWAKQIESQPGPCAWVVRVKDFDGEIKRLREAGVKVDDAVRNGRVRPDGTRLEWEAAKIGEDPTGTFFPSLEHDFTPRQNRASLTGKPTTRDFGGVAKVVIAVRDMDRAIQRFHQAYGVPPPIKQVDAAFGAQLALLGNIPVILAAPLNGRSWLNDRLARFGEGPCAFVLSARRPGAYKPASRTRWFGVDISWFDAEKLGWRLGYE